MIVEVIGGKKIQHKVEVEDLYTDDNNVSQSTYDKKHHQKKRCWQDDAMQCNDDKKCKGKNFIISVMQTILWVKLSKINVVIVELHNINFVLVNAQFIDVDDDGKKQVPFTSVKTGSNGVVAVKWGSLGYFPARILSKYIWI